MKISIHRNKLRFVLYIKLTCTWFKICILICCVCVVVRFYYKRNITNSFPLYIIKQMHAWNAQILRLKLKLAARFLSADADLLVCISDKQCYTHFNICPFYYTFSAIHASLPHAVNCEGSVFGAAMQSVVLFVCV